MIYRALFNVGPLRPVDRRGDRGNLAFSALCRGDAGCLRFSVSRAKATITDSPIAVKRAEGPSTPTLWQLTRAPSSSSQRLSASRSGLAIPDSRQSFASRLALAPAPWAPAAGASERQQKAVGEQIGLGDPGIAAKLRQPIALRGLEFLDEVPGRMPAFGQFDRRVSHVTAPAIVARALGTATDPGMKLRQRVIGMCGFKSGPNLVRLASDVAKASHHQIVLRAEVTIQRHLVGVGGIRG